MYANYIYYYIYIYNNLFNNLNTIRYITYIIINIIFNNNNLYIIYNILYIYTGWARSRATVTSLSVSP